MRRTFGWKNRWLWLVIGLVIAAVGSFGAIFGAQVMAKDGSADADNEFATASADVSMSLSLVLDANGVLLRDARDLLFGNPTLTGEEFAAWMADRVGTKGDVGIESVGVIGYVRRSPQSLIPSNRALSPNSESMIILQTEHRSTYCVLANAGWAARPMAFPNVDLCQGGFASILIASRDSGRESFFATGAVGPQMQIIMLQPIYAGGGTPTSIELRQTQLIGWIGVTISPESVLRAATAGAPETEMIATLDFQSIRVATINVGAADILAHDNDTRNTINLADGWTLRTTGPGTPSGIFDHTDATRLAWTGTLASVLLGMLMFVVGTSRERARKLVARRTAELHHQALHDTLTDLPNRALITDRIDQLLARGRRDGIRCAALFIDLDGFKNINDTLGHAAGDQLLVAVADRLTTTLREADTVGRLGGDEFVVLIDSSMLEDSTEMVANRILIAMREPFHIDTTKQPLLITASVGIASGLRANAGELLRDADLALYRAKGNGRDCYASFHPELQTVMARRVELEYDVRAALVNNEYFVMYQPIYNLDDLTLIGAEALLRWNHPKYGTIGPDEFIPILEQGGHIGEVGRWVLNEACQQMALWHRVDPALTLAVNVSARQFATDAIIEHINDALTASELPGKALTIEMTETVLMRNPQHSAELLQRIKELGCMIAIDDFGTGYSSLAYLQQFPVDILKIDRSFTNGIHHTPEATALVATLADLGRKLGLVTLAEGVETIAQLDELRACEVNEAQGFLFSRPLMKKSFEDALLTAATAQMSAVD